MRCAAALREAYLEGSPRRFGGRIALGLSKSAGFLVCYLGR
jgi:hypothetical protein